MTKLKMLALGVGLAGCMSANAGVVTLSPMVGWHEFDHEENGIDDDKQFTAALGYRFTPAFSIEGSAGKSTSDTQGTNVYWKHRDLNAMYRFNADGALQPFVLGGGGRWMGSADGDNQDEDFAQLGLGVIYGLSKNFGLRAETRAMYTPNDNWLEYAGLVGVELGFGAFGDDAPAARAAEPEPAPAEEPAAAPAEPAAAPVEEPAAAPVAVAPVDSDNDGVVDADDKCPDTKAGAAVDAKGCYEMLSEAVAIAIDVKFATGKADIQGDASAEVQKVVDFMKKYPEVKVTIEGHTDSRGNEAKNKALSQKRADAVKAEVVKAGVDAARLTAEGFGSAKPVADNKTEEGRAKNRRVVASAKAEAKTIKMKK